MNATTQKEAGRASAAMTLLDLTWERGLKDSWGRINNSMRSALRLAIGAGLDFRATDFSEMYSKFRAGFWIGADPEWIYRVAVCDLNRSAFEAWEEHEGRKPFFANDVRAESYGGFLHVNSIRRDRERLAQGFGFKMDGKVWFCTGFAPDKIRVVLYKQHFRDGKPVKLKAMTHAELLEACPAPKKKRSKSVKLILS